MMIQNQKGLSIVELLIATGIASVVSFAIFAVHSFMMRSQVTALDKVDVADLRYEISSIFSKEANCTSLLAGKASVAGTAVDVSNNIRAGVTWGRLRITSVRLQGVRSLGSAGKTSAKLQITGTRIGQVLGDTNFNEYINIYYTVNGGNTITTCRDDTAVCARMGGVMINNHCDFCTSLGGAVRANGTCAPTL
jgi:Type II secretory pathway, component PulJ